MTEEQDQRDVHQAQEEVHELLKEIPRLCGKVGELVAGVSGLKDQVGGLKSDLGREISALRRDNADDHRTIFERLKSLNHWRAKVIGIGLAVGFGTPVVSAIVVGLLNGHIRIQP
jgi:uncharacterized protein YbjQ (UPF0145 family)